MGDRPLPIGISDFEDMITNGFKADEVRKMCHDYGMDGAYETVKDWYDGYTFGQTDIYNPWSVIQYLSGARANTDWLPMSYWANISSNDIVRTLIDRADDEDRDNLWNFMFFTGYFRKVKEWMSGTSIYAQLAIANKEVQ